MSDPIAREAEERRQRNEIDAARLAIERLATHYRIGWDTAKRLAEDPVYEGIREPSV